MRRMNNDLVIITRMKPLQKIARMVLSLVGKGVNLVEVLIRYWVEVYRGIMSTCLEGWIQKENMGATRWLWLDTVRKKVKKYQADSR